MFFFLPPQVHFNAFHILTVIMTKKTGKPRGRPRKAEDAGLKKKRESDRRRYQRKKGRVEEEEENEPSDQWADVTSDDENVMTSGRGRPKSVTDDEAKRKRQERNQRYYESKKTRILKVKLPLVSNAPFFSRVLRDSTPRFVSPSVGPSVGPSVSLSVRWFVCHTLLFWR